MEEQLKVDLKKAQIEKNEVKVSTLRLLLAEIHNAQITLRTNLGQEKVLTDAEVIQVIQREVKKRKEAIDSFRSGGREEQAKQEQAELEVLQGYLPPKLSNEELTKLVEDSITEVGASSVKDLGQVMGVVMAKVAGRADGGRVSELVKQKLTSQ